MSTWNNVPELALTEIYKQLAFKDKLNASSTCRRWRECLFEYNQLSLGYLRLAFGDEARRFDPETRLTKSKLSEITTPTHQRCLRKRKCSDEDGNSSTFSVRKCLIMDDIQACTSGIISKFIKYYNSVDIFFECGLTLLISKSHRNTSPAQVGTTSLVESADMISEREKDNTYEEVSNALLSTLNDLIRKPMVKILSLKPYFKCECNYCQYVKSRDNRQNNNLNTWRQIQRKGAVLQALERKSHFDNQKFSNIIGKSILQSSSLQKFSLGFVPIEVINPYNILLRMSKSHNHISNNDELKELNIAAIPPSSGTIDLTCLQKFSLQNFSQFTSLSRLTLNIESVSDSLLHDLIDGAAPNLSTLNLFLTNYGPRFDFPSDGIWQNISQRRENFGVNLIFAEVFYARAVRNEEEVLKPHLPLKGLYYIYQDHHPWHILHAIDNWYCRTLEIISVHYVKGDTNFHPLSPFDWLIRVKRCAHLKKFAVSGLDFRDYELIHTVYDVKELEEFYISSCDVRTDSEESPEGTSLSSAVLKKFEAIIAKFLQKPWKTSRQQPLQKKLTRKKNISNHNVTLYLLQEFCQFC